MPSTQQLTRRIRAVRNTRQITRAMEMVSATKMRRSQEAALLSRPYAFKVMSILRELTRRTPYVPELMRERTVRKTAIVVVASDRGLAGSFNANLFRELERLLVIQHSTADSSQKASHVFIAVGKKADEYLRRRGRIPEKTFMRVGDFVSLAEVDPLIDYLISGFRAGAFDRVIAVATQFRSTLKQDVIIRPILPVISSEVSAVIEEIVPERGRYAGGRETESETAPAPRDFEYLIEPEPQRVLDSLAPKLVGITIYHTVLEANASEHSARMVAMKHASENAEELRGDLSLEFNKLRQSLITKEIGEIVSGAEALTN